MGVFLIAAAAAAAAGAKPAPAPVSHDLQCLVLAGTMANSDDEKTKVGAMMASMFFAGKVFGATPSIDLKTALEAEAGHLAKVDPQALAKECGGEMQTRGAQIEAAGSALGAEGK